MVKLSSIFTGKISPDKLSRFAGEANRNKYKISLKAHIFAKDVEQHLAGCENVALGCVQICRPTPSPCLVCLDSGRKSQMAAHVNFVFQRIFESNLI